LLIFFYIGYHKNLLNCDRIYCELIGENRKDVLDNILDKSQKAFMFRMKNFISVLRTEYVYALLFEKDFEKAQKIKSDFEKAAEKYPHQSSVESERDLIHIAESLSLR